MMAFVASGDEEVLLVRRSRTASPYPDRLSTAAGALDPGELPEDAARRAVATELGVTAEPIRAGLAVEFTDTIRKRSVTFRVYPVLCRVTAVPRVDEARWLTPDQVIVRAALGETVPELDEALARVWHPAEALPPLFRDEARAIHRDATTPTVALAARASAMVLAGAPPERVAALRPARARIVNAARAAARTATARDVPGELMRADAGMRRFVDVELRRAGADAPSVVFAEAVTPAGDAVLRASPPPGRLWIAADPWTEWDDEVPPPLEPGMAIARRGAYERLLTLPS
ncbi:MAG TPA: NUDIX hydrolase [Haliangiales bacterium]|nr:NUDIX hydrolase [Haliangiales bacterium]